MVVAHRHAEEFKITIRKSRHIMFHDTCYLPFFFFFLGKKEAEFTFTSYTTGNCTI